MDAWGAIPARPTCEPAEMSALRIAASARLFRGSQRANCKPRGSIVRLSEYLIRAPRTFRETRTEIYFQKRATYFRRSAAVAAEGKRGTDWLHAVFDFDGGKSMSSSHGSAL